MNGDTIVNYSSVEKILTSVANVITLIEDAKSKSDSLIKKMEIGDITQAGYYGTGYHTLHDYYKCIDENLEKLSSYITYVQEYIRLVVDTTKAEDDAIKKLNTTDTVKVNGNG